MKLDHEFYKLPFTFDVEKLQEEVAQFTIEDWTDRGAKSFEGNTAIQLVSTDGEMNDSFNGPMETTDSLEKCPYIKQVIAQFDQVVGRSRLMRVAPGKTVPPHRDSQYHWYKRSRLHIPIFTSDKVRFLCNDKEINMKAGETWLLNTWELHSVHNDSDEFRVHLVVDFSPSGNFWDLLNMSYKPGYDSIELVDSKFVEFDEGGFCEILTEKYCVPLVMSAGEADGIMEFICREVQLDNRNNESDLAKFENLVRLFKSDWRAHWYRYGAEEVGMEIGTTMLRKYFNDFKNLGVQLVLPSGAPVLNVVKNLVFSKLVNMEQLGSEAV
ncbi:MAG: aspartyl/asparaginyl beta-hydroxylase domain-containing protein [Flavobacteriales bacterium]|nr:aspartyl/asparaginyl beta-hydroxylase domain-containing protein [Flavobacteriales bacterium]